MEKDNYTIICERLEESFENGIYDEETPITTILENMTAEFYEKGE